MWVKDLKLGKLFANAILVPKLRCMALSVCVAGTVISVLSRVNNIRGEFLTPYRAVKYDCVKLKGFFSYNSVIYCKFCRRYIIVLLVA